MTDKESPNPRPVIQPDELSIIKKCIEDGDVVFDVGAYHGEWSNHVQKLSSGCSFHMFEASPEAYKALASKDIPNGVANHAAVTDKAGLLAFHVYRDKPMLSTAYRRVSVEPSLMPSGFDTYQVPSLMLDEYWPVENGLINFLKVDVEGAEYDVLRGANDLLRRGAIDYIQFEYGGTFADSGTTLEIVYYYLKRHGYHLFQVNGDEFVHITHFTAALEDFNYANYLAVNERHLSRFKNEKPKISIYFDELEQLGIEVKGVVHVGAHDGAETDCYLDRGLAPVVLVEANPEYAHRLRSKYRDVQSVYIAENAICDRAGEVQFNIANSDQSSSLLELGVHAELYPSIQYSKKISVQAQTLDDCLNQTVASPEQRSLANLLVMDIQGAELMALRGAGETLAHLDAIQLEVNYQELYKGCPIIWEIDEFLQEHGFIRYKTDTPFHRSWGDALYVRKPVISNSTIGTLGRFGNHFFQYLFLKHHALDLGYDYYHSPWIGDKIFNTSPAKTISDRTLREVQQTLYSTQTCTILNSADRLANSEITGFFQYNTTLFKRHRERIQSTFSFKGKFGERAAYIRDVFKEREGPVIGIHLRRGDYGNRWFFIAPTKWYADWIRRLQAEHPKLTVFIASDEPERVVSDFAEFDLLTSRDFKQSDIDDPQFFDDFAALTLCDRLAISNSSFSFAASMLNQFATQFVRPDLAARGLIDYDPWRSEPLLRDELAEDHGSEFVKP
ncbi:MAG: FkbM family methyltransferase [Henriciella sp.]